MTTYVLLEIPDGGEAAELLDELRDWQVTIAYYGTTNPVHDECDDRGQQ